MSENYKFFQNTKCEYFPCHQVKNVEDFNCLFCYCPLYMLKDECGGSFKYTNGFKDCSECTITHGRKSHDYVMSKMGRIMEIGAKKEI